MKLAGCVETLIYTIVLWNACFGYLYVRTMGFRNKAKSLLRNWRMLPEGFSRPKDDFGRVLSKRPRKPKEPIRVHTVEELKGRISEGYRVKDLDVRGDVYNLLFSTSQVHPVVKLMHERKANGSTAESRTDPYRVAIALEGGGMRGCVGAGMITAFWYLGLQDSVDVVYGSSAGSLVGAYFLAKQLPYFGPEIYYDVLTTAGKEFIDAQNILRSCGLGIFDLRIKSLTQLFTDRMGRPVLNLNYLFDTIVKKIKPLDWEVFWKEQQSSRIPLKVVTSGLLSRKAVVLSAEAGNFQNIDELAECMKASMLLPGITGDAVRLQGRQAMTSNVYRPDEKESVSEPLCDALLFEPVPYRSAIKEGCSHVVALRTRADDLSVTKKMGVVEKMIMSRFFGRKLKLPELVDWMHNQYHKLVYAEDVLRLNAANRDFSEEVMTDGKIAEPKLYAVALPPGVKEIARMETSREVIFENVRVGFAAAYDGLVLDPAQRGKGYEIAKQIWPDSILTQTPAHLQFNTTSLMSYLPSEQESVTSYDGIELSSEYVNDSLIAEEDWVTIPEQAESALLQSSPSTVALPLSKRKKLLQSLGKLQRMLTREVK